MACGCELKKFSAFFDSLALLLAVAAAAVCFLLLAAAGSLVF
jgi:hypothetical protein